MLFPSKLCLLILMVEVNHIHNCSLKRQISLLIHQYMPLIDNFESKFGYSVCFNEIFGISWDLFYFWKQIR